jgi:hypothetical protein
MLFRLVELMKQHSDEIAALESLDAGRSRMRIRRKSSVLSSVSSNSATRPMRCAAWMNLNV